METEGKKEEVKEPEEKAEGKKPEVIDPEEFHKLQAALKDANKESAARRKKLEEYEKAEADRKLAEMSEVEKAAALATQETEKRKKAEEELNRINLERSFEKASKALKYEYADEQAEKDALGYLAGSSPDTMEDDLKNLAQSRPYLFKIRQEKPPIDSQDKGTQLPGEMTESRRKELEQRIPSLRKT